MERRKSNNKQIFHFHEDIPKEIFKCFDSDHCCHCCESNFIWCTFNKSHSGHTGRSFKNINPPLSAEPEGSSCSYITATECKIMTKMPFTLAFLWSIIYLWSTEFILLVNKGFESIIFWNKKMKWNENLVQCRPFDCL